MSSEAGSYTISTLLALTFSQIWLIPLVDVPKFTYFTKLEKQNPGPDLIKQNVFANSNNSKLNDHV
jgi:hypothetical protein